MPMFLNNIVAGSQVQSESNELIYTGNVPWMSKVWEVGTLLTTEA